jgi:para-aminobenzoate synthetase component 2
VNRHTVLLVIDNYDSFTYNLVQYFGQLGVEQRVFRNDQITVEQALALNPDRVMISPGPCTPTEAGVSCAMIEAFAGRKPLLGVCLGHQAIAEAMGATVRQADELMHGKTSQVAHDDSLIFTDVAQPFTATRYHSLAVVDSTVPADLVVTARTEKGKNSAGGVIMGLQHATKPIYGVQYHPESVLTEGGYLMLGNWLESLGLVGASERGKALSPMVKL